MTYSRSSLYKKRLYRVVLLFSAILFLWGGCSNKKPAADTILTNARVYTVDADKPWAEAVAVRNERILFVGSVRDVLRYRGPDTKIIDAGGRLLLPGIEDSHVHFVSGSESLAKVDLSGTRKTSPRTISPASAGSASSPASNLSMPTPILPGWEPGSSTSAPSASKGPSPGKRSSTAAAASPSAATGRL